MHQILILYHYEALPCEWQCGICITYRLVFLFCNSVAIVDGYHQRCNDKYNGMLIVESTFGGGCAPGHITRENTRGKRGLLICIICHQTGIPMPWKLDVAVNGFYSIYCMHLAAGCHILEILRCFWKLEYVILFHGIWNSCSMRTTWIMVTGYTSFLKVWSARYQYME